MKYKDFNGTVDELVLLKVKEIEEREHIKVLHVVESGSRAWGFASPDSDYDVRFIYVRDEDFYLSLKKTEDYIDWELNDVLDINGWDLKKALQHFHRSNATMFEWCNSPGIILRKNGSSCTTGLPAGIFPANRRCIIIMVRPAKIIIPICGKIW